jgi:UDP-galactopyranose mutase
MVSNSILTVYLSPNIEEQSANRVGSSNITVLKLGSVEQGVDFCFGMLAYRGAGGEHPFDVLHKQESRTFRSNQHSCSINNVL